MDNKQQTYRRQRGDRRDGRLLRSLAPFYRFTPFIMKTRGDASNYFKDRADIAAAEAYIRQVRSEGYNGIGMLHFFLACYVRCVSQFPALNRFVSGYRLYARNNIEVVMTVKKKLSVDSGETTFKVILAPTDDIRIIYEKMRVEIEKIKADTEDNSTEKVAGTLIRLPRLLLRAAIRFVGWLDYHGWAPQMLLDASPFHGSLVITDLGSLGIGTIYHHLYNFGNIPLFLSFGAKYREFEVERDGNVVEHRYIDYSIVTDERICDGYYYANAFRHMKYYLRNPKLLDQPPETVERDVD